MLFEMRCARLLTATFALLAGCSLGMKTVPPNHPASEAPACTVDNAAPSADFLGGALVAVGGLGASYAIGMNNCSDSGDEPCSIDSGWAVLSVITAAALFASGIHGVRALRECRQAKRAHRAWLGAGRPDDVDDVERQREKRVREKCSRWRDELTHAKSAEVKRAVIRRKPEACADW